MPHLLDSNEWRWRVAPGNMTPEQSIAHYRINRQARRRRHRRRLSRHRYQAESHVAIKVLPSAFAEAAAHMQRLEREAQVLASLNHPNIAALYGIERSAIVMELVEGEEFKGPVPVETALAYARQIAIAAWWRVK